VAFEAGSPVPVALSPLPDATCAKTHTGDGKPVYAVLSHPFKAQGIFHYRCTYFGRNIRLTVW